MKIEFCSGCSFSEKRKGKTKPMYHCHYGRYKEEGGFPCAWIKKCAYYNQIIAKKEKQYEFNG